jgi:antitoxin component YwqK of YwqJK toxin-antitoxin module
MQIMIKIFFSFFLYFTCTQCNSVESKKVDILTIDKIPTPVLQDTILKKYYPNQQLSYCIIKEDSNTSKELHVFFYENGVIKEKGFQDLVSNREVQTKSSVGTWFKYDSVGKLLTETKYNNLVFDSASIEVKQYFNNGKLRSVAFYNNYILYETDIKKTGVWLFYNKKGDLIKKEIMK